LWTVLGTESCDVALVAVPEHCTCVCHGTLRGFGDRDVSRSPGSTAASRFWRRRARKCLQSSRSCCTHPGAGAAEAVATAAGGLAAAAGNQVAVAVVVVVVASGGENVTIIAATGAKIWAAGLRGAGGQATMTAERATSAGSPASASEHKWLCGVRFISRMLWM
jgi:hypothetical protein